jgi:hypothetical protein
MKISSSLSISTTILKFNMATFAGLAWAHIAVTDTNLIATRIEQSGNPPQGSSPSGMSSSGWDTERLLCEVTENH